MSQSETKTQHIYREVTHNQLGLTNGTRKGKIPTEKIRV